jgi:hypothetical protein
MPRKKRGLMTKKPKEATSDESSFRTRSNLALLIAIPLPEANLPTLNTSTDL